MVGAIEIGKKRAKKQSNTDFQRWREHSARRDHLAYSTSTRPTQITKGRRRENRGRSLLFIRNCCPGKARTLSASDRRLDRRTRKTTKECKKESRYLGPPVTEFTEVDHLRHRILDTLFKVPERNGVKVVVGDTNAPTFKVMVSKLSSTSGEITNK